MAIRPGSQQSSHKALQSKHARGSADANDWFASLTQLMSFFLKLLPSSRELQPDDAGDDQADAAEANGGRRLAQQIDAEQRGADRADAGPHRIGRADRQRLQ